jgi:hypothetical protein
VTEVTSSIDAKIAQLDTKKSQLVAMVAEKKSKVQHLSSQIENAKLLMRGNEMVLEQNFRLQELVSQRMLIENEGKGIRAKIEQINNKSLQADTICPQCYGKVDPANAHRIVELYETQLVQKRQEFSEANTKVLEAQNGIKARKTELEDESNAKIAALQSESADLNEEIKQALPQIENQYLSRLKQFKQDKAALIASVAKEIGDINAKYDKLIEPFIIEKLNKESRLNKVACDYQSAMLVPKPSISVEDLSRIGATRQSLEQSISEKSLARLKNPYEEVLKSLQESVNTIEDKLNLEASEIRATEAILPYYDFWANVGVKEIKSFLVDQIVPMLNAQIDYWMQVIYHGAISVNFDKYLNVVISNNASKSGLSCYGQGSGGERRRIDMAIMLAFRQIMKMSTGRDPNVVFFDEVAENIDGHGLQWLYDVLNDISKISRVYVITHNPGLLNLLQSADKLSLVKENGNTTLV